MSLKAILLCAGTSKRFGTDNKLLHEIDGTPICVHALNSLLASSAAQIVVVTGHQSDQVTSAINTHCNIAPTNERVRFIHNPIFDAGMGSSIAAAISDASDSEAIVVCLGDMPHVKATVIDALYEAWQSNPEHLACVPVCGGKRGNPVLLASGLFERLKTLTGDSGARHILAKIEKQVLELDVGTSSIFKDIDEQADLD